MLKANNRWSITGRWRLGVKPVGAGGGIGWVALGVAIAIALIACAWAVMMKDKPIAAEMLRASQLPVDALPLRPPTGGIDQSSHLPCPACGTN